MRSITLATLLVLASAAPAVANAQATGDAAAGKLKAYTCTGCHGITGYKNAYPHYNVPRISGQNYQYLVSALNAYKAGQRQHPTMAAQAESLTEQDIADIASYLAASPTTP
jgi:cytochrome c553